MSSTETNNSPEPSTASQASQSLAQQHSAVSPLIQSITRSGTNPAFSPDLANQESADGQLDEQPTGEQPTGEQKLLPDQLSSEPLPQQELLSLSEQYGPTGLLAELDSLIETQQFQLEQHREHVLRSRAELRQQIENWQARCAALDAQLVTARDRAASLEQKHLASQSKVLPLEARLDAAQQQTERLRAEVLDRRQQQMMLEEQLTLAETTLREQQEITAAQARSLVSMQAELSEAQAAVAILETRLARQGDLRQQLKADGNRDRQARSQARSRQLQLERETAQMTGQLLRLNEELRQAQRRSAQWRRQAQTQAEQLQDIGHWAAGAESVPPELMALLEPFLQGLADSTGEDAVADGDSDRGNFGHDTATHDDIAKRDVSHGAASQIELLSHSNQSEQSDSVINSSSLADSAGPKPLSSKLSLVAEPVSEASFSAEEGTALSDSAPSNSQEGDSVEASHASALNLPSFPQDAV